MRVVRAECFILLVFNCLGLLCTYASALDLAWALSSRYSLLLRAIPFILLINVGLGGLLFHFVYHRSYLFIYPMQWFLYLIAILNGIIAPVYFLFREVFWLYL